MKITFFSYRSDLEYIKNQIRIDYKLFIFNLNTNITVLVNNLFLLCKHSFGEITISTNRMIHTYLYVQCAVLE